MADADKWEATNRLLVVYDIWLYNALGMAFKDPRYLVWYGLEFCSMCK